MSLVQPETPLRLLSASYLHSHLTLLVNAVSACRTELRRRPSHCLEPTGAEAPPNAASSCMLMHADFPCELLVILAEKLGNPLALLVSKAHLSKDFCKAARAAQATLTTVNLHGRSTAAVEAVTSGCPQLTSLDLSCCGITDAAVVAVAAGCKQLTLLSLLGCRNITNVAVKAVVSGCKELTSLNMCNMWITDEAVVSVALGCKQLASLDLHGCSNITDAAVVAVASACPQLASLDLTWCCNITDAAVVAVASGYKQLTTLHLSRCRNITAAAKASIPNTVRVC